MTSVFRARGVSVSFGGVRAVAGVDLEIEAGELVGLIGPNGAGKTTFIDAITGFVKSEGTVELGDAALNGLPPHVRAQRGLARTWQTVELFDDLTVRENLTVAAKGGKGVSVDEELKLLDLVHAAESMPWELSQAERKRAGIGRALVAKPRLLCLDEPAAAWTSGKARSSARCCQASRAPARRYCSSTTTWALSFQSATGSWSLSRVPSSPRAPRRRYAATNEWSLPTLGTRLREQREQHDGGRERDQAGAGLCGHVHGGARP